MKAPRTRTCASILAIWRQPPVNAAPASIGNRSRPIARRRIRHPCPHVSKQRVAFVNFVFPDIRADELLVDDSASAVNMPTLEMVHVTRV